MKNEKIINAINTIQPDTEAENRVLAKINQKLPSPRPFFRSTVTIATAAAVVCLCILGGSMLIDTTPWQTINPARDSMQGQTENSFVLTAYAMAQQPDGTVENLGQIEFAQEGTTQDTPFDGTLIVSRGEGENFFVEVTQLIGIAFRCEGENIQTVKFSVDNGNFIKLNEDGEWVLFGTFYTINQAEFAYSHPIYWAVNTGLHNVEKFEDTIAVTVAFNDGEIREIPIEYDINKGTLVLKER
jgi:hypothetical protein